MLGSHTSIISNHAHKNQNKKRGFPLSCYFVTIFLESLDFILSALPFLITPFLAALSIIEKALAKVTPVGSALTASIADLVLVFVDLLYKAFFLSDLSFFIADLVIGMRLFYPELASSASELRVIKYNSGTEVF